MGPPPSPKEPRRSGRRPAPSSSKSPAGSPPSEANPAATKPKDAPGRPSSNSSHSNGSVRNKRAKNEDLDEPLEELHKNGVNTNGGSLRSKRKGKDKEKIALVVEIPNNDNDGGLEAVADDGAEENGEDEEEGGVTRCICQKYGVSRRVDRPETYCQSSLSGEEENEQGEFMVQCEICKAWQHGQCMHYAAADLVPNHYFCEECRPELWVEVVKDWAVKHARQSSSHSYPPTTPLVANVPRNSRSHSPAVHKTTKRRNTMNSRDAAYDEETLQALIDLPKTEYDLPPRTPISAVSANGGLNGHAEPEHEIEMQVNHKKKRKRSDDDAASVKRTRSASVTSDRPPPSVLARDATPLSVSKGPAGPSSGAPAPRAPNGRNKRAGGRKGQGQDVASVDGEEVASAAPTRKASSRAKANNSSEHTTRRAQANASGAAAGNSAASRAYHHSHAYAVSQQPLFTSWNLPDYLAHLEPMLPTDVPRPLEVRGSVLDGNGRESQDRTAERGVKVKWPSKRMSVGDMNKRVRSLVEWVGREQAAAMERTRRKEALEKALQAHQRAAAGDMDVDASIADGAPAPENGLSTANSAPPPLAEVMTGGGGEDTTMRMMEELMEELIRFQERFGPGAKAKERDRRAGTL
ncbi:hypothetical protein BD309DRAFT_865266 [Dichomitus squalens]|uniref:Uncharacterized protein n=1 Tax=Dichomitus squalens TaxID=114155 RepID=A0A4Q9NQD3_9APHY|nr:hypothetical protein BD309DRAFT_865266 [Dichomitus squalens]TBU64345.1 hypothetical protein BD310DRAFT_806168 [Dichomitus squalens]